MASLGYLFKRTPSRNKRETWQRHRTDMILPSTKTVAGCKAFGVRIDLTMTYGLLRNLKSSSEKLELKKIKQWIIIQLN